MIIHGARFALFLSAALFLALTPGPGMLYVLGRTLHGGRREGVLSSLGTLVGGSAHVVAAAVGLSAILVRFAIAFSLIKYAGAAYLVYLGVTMLKSRSLKVEDEKESSGGNFLQGVWTETLNPKTALFFLSFIPQFISTAHNHLVAQFLLLGGISVALNTCADLVVVLLTGSIAEKLRKNPSFASRQRTASGVGMVGLGIYVAAAK